MPEIPHPHDAKWYAEQLSCLPYQLRQRAIDGYAQVWREAYDAEPAGHRKSNAARRAANTRLREYVKKIVDCC
jgi:hypothetical protein